MTVVMNLCKAFELTIQVSENKMETVCSHAPPPEAYENVREAAGQSFKQTQSFIDRGGEVNEEVNTPPEIQRRTGSA